MTETEIAEFSRQETSRWFYRLRTHPDLQELARKAEDFNVSIDELADEEIRISESGERIVFLRVQKDEVTNYIATGIFEEDENPSEAELVDVRVEKSAVHSPLAGRGTRWQFEDGEVVPREWIS